MNKLDKQYIDLIGEFYKNFISQREGKLSRPPSQEEFINKIKTDDEFAKKWGIEIGERELNLDERAKLHSNPEMFYDINATLFSIQDSIEDSNYPDKIWLHEQFTKGNIPTKLITITYNSKTIETYE